MRKKVFAMPELPEVETVRRLLEPQIAGHTIENAAVSRPEVIAHPSSDLFCRGVSGKTIGALSRRGKFLIIGLKDGELKDGGRIVLHLRMTGCLLAAPPKYPKEKHTHVTFVLSGGLELRFSDTRRFGRLWYISPKELDAQENICGMDKLGLEPWDAKLTADYLQTYFGRSRRAIKQCLLAQEAVAGIGNIYSDEILFAARIRPQRPANSLTCAEWGRLCQAIPQRLLYFIDKNKMPPQDYLAGRGRDYRNTPFLQMYGRAGQRCPVCQTTLCRDVLGGRSSVYCPNCQK